MIEIIFLGCRCSACHQSHRTCRYQSRVYRTCYRKSGLRAKLCRASGELRPLWIHRATVGHLRAQQSRIRIRTRPWIRRSRLRLRTRLRPRLRIWWIWWLLPLTKITKIFGSNPLLLDELDCNGRGHCPPILPQTLSSAMYMMFIIHVFNFYTTSFPFL